MIVAAAGHTGAADQAITLHARAWMPDTSASVTGWARGLSWIGDFPRRMLACAVAAAYLLWQRRWRSAILLVAVILLVGTAVDDGLKPWFDRPRPTVVPWLTHATAPSLPSGHAAGAAVSFLGIALFVGNVGPLRRYRLLLVGIAVAVALGVGWSRIWLGVHWASDVLAGWALGAAAALAAFGIARRVDAPADS